MGKVEKKQWRIKDKDVPIDNGKKNEKELHPNVPKINEGDSLNVPSEKLLLVLYQDVVGVVMCRVIWERIGKKL